MDERSLNGDGFRRVLGRSLPRLFGPLPPELRQEICGYFDRVTVPSGTTLYRRGDPGDSMHIVVTGRLSVRIPDGSGGEREVRHLAAGDPLGEIALLTGQSRTANVIAIRDTTLGRLTKESFDAFVSAHPGAALDMARFTIRLLTESEVAAASSPTTRNIALLALDPDFPLREFSRRLEVALLRFGSVEQFDSSRVRRILDLPADEPDPVNPASEALGRLLDESENTRRFVLYRADSQLTGWTRKCLSQADRILLVADGSASPESRAVEEEIRRRAGDRLLAERSLVLVHFDSRAPSGTAEWLAERDSARHYHVRWQGASGIQRLARLLADQAVTLVLGAGGARGFVHIGVVRALREAGIPIDAVGGSSIGSMIGVTVALDWSDEEILARCKRAFVDEKPMNDYTFPMFALLRGKKLSRTLHRHLGDIDIVDTWLPFFCVSTNISNSRAMTHRSGTLWRALQASVSLPAILPPFVEGGQLHVDGATLDTLPVDTMKRWMAGRLIAVDPSVHREYSLRRKVAPSPLGYIGEQLLPGRRLGGFPSISSVILKSTILGGSSSLAAARDQADLYLNPPVAEFGLLDWSRFYDLVDAGYQYARREIADWVETRPDIVQRDLRLGLPAAAAAG